MELFFREKGQGNRTIIIVHGLYGASDNWLSVARELENDFRVIMVDQRNHGKSPHSEEHTYKTMADDLNQLMDKLNLEKAIMIGHSMGGKTVMRFCLEHPEKVEKMIVVDIAPKSYDSFSNYAEVTANHKKIIEALAAIDPSQYGERKDIDKALSGSFPDKRLRAFLMKNLRREKNGTYSWQLNLEALKNNMQEIMDGFSNLNKGESEKMPETVFIKGENSPYINEDDTIFINNLFPGSQIVNIPEAGHWVHAEKPELFIKTIRYFLG
ncbi:alpha/beta fold hydrolase [Marinilabilia rubra]|uniref:Alpha/beta hydrolase n=1 Tax=Marinilabilia rubra TaxID=2162893 RepID=A0A2U2B9U2_9BACT|nr:alpha/beta fold hydrolase [Marinilabilia rubra]PWD99840.1 alpha/beta hydrolase [Marinilabilia rubra]